MRRLCDASAKAGPLQHSPFASRRAQSIMVVESNLFHPATACYRHALLYLKNSAIPRMGGSYLLFSMMLELVGTALLRSFCWCCNNAAMEGQAAFQPNTDAYQRKLKRMEVAVRNMLLGIGEDISRQGLLDTPKVILCTHGGTACSTFLTRAHLRWALCIRAACSEGVH